MVYLVTLAFVGMDMVTGLIKAFKNHTYNSSLMREGLYHKCGSLLAIGFGILVDYAQRYIDLGVNIPIAFAICSYISIMEIGSIIENIGAINPDILPSKLRSYFSKLSKGDSEDENLH
jgi:polar amino acid transport system substrate-binding protein